MSDLFLEGTKLPWYRERVEAWLDGERVNPITVDMSLLPRKNCNFNCVYCYANLQENQGHLLEKFHINRFLDDCADLDVKGISLVSDGESSHHPDFVYTILEGADRGLAMAVGTNGLVTGYNMLEEILPFLTYIRFNISAANHQQYAEIMGAKLHWFDRVIQNIQDAVFLKEAHGWPVTIGMQMVLQPEYGHQIVPLAKLAVKLGVDYLVIKHCSDDENGTLGVDYSGYAKLEPLLKLAEKQSTFKTKIIVKWNKIKAGNVRSYQRCYGPPFHIQLSGSGLVAPCGMLFHERYKKLFHIGSIWKKSFKEIVESERYWEVMNRLASPEFNAQTMCGYLCLQHHHNEFLDKLVKREETLPDDPGTPPAHLPFL